MKTKKFKIINKIYNPYTYTFKGATIFSFTVCYELDDLSPLVVKVNNDS